MADFTVDDLPERLHSAWQPPGAALAGQDGRAMTTLLPPPRSSARSSASSSARSSARSSEQVRQDLSTRRPLVLLATAGGVAAAAATLLVCLATGVAGWYLTDGGSHGAPRDGLRVGALSWLMGHG